MVVGAVTHPVIITSSPGRYTLLTLPPALPCLLPYPASCLTLPPALPCLLPQPSLPSPASSSYCSLPRPTAVTL
ncbi:hypothetical protein Pmani_014484 [Petrolisthes manimaculis]|uniref:Uncharacterized protein n=1 Tax=Petrolisthes manimaculis TaxID=1843537 RepID=A0AAE1UAY0_9EUCA|nr:hypothetical protein Pmani_014484 [Petrolisthes manimaculis]